MTAQPSFTLHPVPPAGGLACPEPGCGAGAVLLDRFWLPSTSGPVAHWKTRCAGGHVRTPRMEETSAAGVG